MAKTQISDVVVPEVFNPYVIERTAEKSAVFQSGLVSDLNAQLAGQLSTVGGQLVNMPFWHDLTGADEVLSDSAALTPAKIDADQDIAALLTRGKAWSANDLAVDLAGDDPLEDIVDRVARYWARMQQTALINALAGAMGAATMTANVHDISAETGSLANITGSTMADAAQKLGDSKDLLAAVAMHSATENQLAKNDMIIYERDSQGTILKRFFLGLPVIVDDGLPVSTDIYTTYLFGEGAIGYAEVLPKTPSETDRDALAGDDILVSRRHYLLHPRGIAYTGTDMRPTNAQLATVGNWERKYEAKNIRIVQFIHKLDQ